MRWPNQSRNRARRNIWQLCSDFNHNITREMNWRCPSWFKLGFNQPFYKHIFYQLSSSKRKKMIFSDRRLSILQPLQEQILRVLKTIYVPQYYSYTVILTTISQERWGDGGGNVPNGLTLRFQSIFVHTPVF